ncbi:MAG: radical SAM protein [Candidatus Nealsonbacteria bacterium]|nr:radical SAM protein [Candidatus Nealsonbacteria bacterium]
MDGEKINLNSEKIPRFAFRREYFGGLLLDLKNTTYELIKPEEIKFLKKIKDKEKLFLQKLKNPFSRKIVKKFSDRGVLNTKKSGELFIVDTREISDLGKTPSNFLSAPLKVYDTYTKQCNLNCKHCYARSNSSVLEKSRTLNQTRKIMKKFYDVGVLEWNFTGGEPTVAPNLLEAIKIAKNFRMRVVLNTNGCWSSETAKKILPSGVNEFIISLEGRQETNDERRGSGNFRKAIKTLDKIHEYKKSNPTQDLEVILNMTVGKDNVSDIGFVTKLATKYKFGVKFVTLKPAGRASENLPERTLSAKEYMEFAERVQDLREEQQIKESGIPIILNHQDLFSTNYSDRSSLPYPFNYSECTALTTAMDILPDGKVIACSFLMDFPEFIGPNILDVSVSEAWRHPAMERFRWAKKEDCVDCGFYMNKCRGYCRSTVLLNGGKIEGRRLNGKDPYCFRSLLP